MKTKRCCTCKKRKRLTSFNLRTQSPDGRDWRCRACCIADGAKRYRKNRVAVLAKQKAWRLAHPEEVRANYMKNREQQIRASRAWQKKNPERHKANKTAWIKNNPDKARAIKQRTYQRHRDKILARHKNYYQENKARFAKYNKAYYWANRDKELAAASAWQAAHRDYRKKYHAKWCKENYDHMRAVANSNYALRKSLRAGDQKAVRVFYKHVRTAPVIVCHWCKKEVPRPQRRVDHYMPICKGGKHCVTNLVPACATCNARKGRKLPEEFAAKLTA